MNTFFCDHFQTELGAIEIKANERFIKSIHFVGSPTTPSPNKVTEQAKQQLLEYFSKQRKQFDLPLDAEGTEFQKKVWNTLSTIPYGKTCSYGDIAKKINNPKGMRAVGMANGKNPMTIVVPCHRVIGANGKLTGYAHGTDRKQKLLLLETDGLF